MQNEKQAKQVKGYSLFNDIEDRDLRIRNRAVVLTNIMEDGFVQGRVSSKSALIIMNYFHHVPEEEKDETLALFQTEAKARGFVKQED